MYRDDFDERLKDIDSSVFLIGAGTETTGVEPEEATAVWHGIVYLAWWIGTGVLVGGVVTALRDPAREAMTTASVTVGASVFFWPAAVLVLFVVGATYTAIRLGLWMRRHADNIVAKKPDAREFAEL